MLIWGGTRTGGFLEFCKQHSNIAIPVLDLLLHGKIKIKERLSQQEVFFLQLLDDIHPVFHNKN